MVDYDKTKELIGWISKVPPRTRREIAFETIDEAMQWVLSMIDAGAIAAEDVIRAVKQRKAS